MADAIFWIEPCDDCGKIIDSRKDGYCMTLNHLSCDDCSLKNTKENASKICTKTVIVDAFKSESNHFSEIALYTNPTEDELVEVPFGENHTATIPKSMEKLYIETEKMFKDEEKRKENKFKPIFYPWYGKCK